MAVCDHVVTTHGVPLAADVSADKYTTGQEVHSTLDSWYLTTAAAVRVLVF
jgi:hypothetical protein